MSWQILRDIKSSTDWFCEYGSRRESGAEGHKQMTETFTRQWKGGFGLGISTSRTIKQYFFPESVNVFWLYAGVDETDDRYALEWREYRGRTYPGELIRAITTLIDLYFICDSLRATKYQNVTRWLRRRLVKGKSLEDNLKDLDAIVFNFDGRFGKSALSDLYSLWDAFAVRAIIGRQKARARDLLLLSACSFSVATFDLLYEDAADYYDQLLEEYESGFYSDSDTDDDEEEEEE